MLPMPIADLQAISRELAATGKRVHVMWQQPESLAFVARGRQYRSEFHVNPSDELMYMVKGEMNLHFRTPEGKEEIAVLKEGCTIYTAGGIPHSPRFPEDAFLLVVERKRHAGEEDAFQWFCPSCDHKLYEARFTVSDYRVDPVSGAYREFYQSEKNRTCTECGHVVPVPDEFAAK
jgi:3-hydroxyanthranilate 3,4-dioxygenase